jgi:hypothetical protein
VRQKSSFAKSKEETSLKLMMDDYYLGSPAYCYCYSLDVKKRMAVIFGGDVSLSLFVIIVWRFLMPQGRKAARPQGRKAARQRRG